MPMCEESPAFGEEFTISYFFKMNRWFELESSCVH